MASTEFDHAKATREEAAARLETILKVVEEIVTTEGEDTPLSIGNEKLVFTRCLRNDNQWDTLKETCRCRFDDDTTIILLLREEDHDEDSNWTYRVAEIFELLISNTGFHGWVVLDLTEAFTNPPNRYQRIESSFDNPLSLFPAGIHSNVMITESIINLQGTRVCGNGLISRTHIGADSTVVNCGQIVGPKGKEQIYDFGKLDITVGAESGGGRSLTLTPESTMKEVTTQLLKPKTTIISADLFQVPMNFISGGSVVRDTPLVQDVYMYSGSAIEAASSVTKALLFPGARVSNASVVSNVLMQWDTSITDNSKINNVMMMEESHCGPSSIVESTVMGPDTHASAGEVNASLFGPNTNAHHQSLLIGVLWPLGRGNVGYGANVGSNHTGRLPDQEATAGEGTFWGLGCVVKFPVDFTWAPYCIVAAGTKLSPSQRIGMPFSLIVDGDSGKNEIVPGWVLQSSPYTLARNDKKYATRRKAKRHASYTGWKMIRPATIEMCRNARNALKANICLEDIPGIGNNILTSRGRDVGTKAYEECIHRYALRGLYDWLQSRNEASGLSNAVQEEFHRITMVDVGSEMFQDCRSVTWPSFPWDDTEDDLDEWEYQRCLLKEEFPIEDSPDAAKWVQICLEKLAELEYDFAARVAKSKARDDVKGSTTIPGYLESHVASEDDPVVLEVRSVARGIDDSVKAILAKL